MGGFIKSILLILIIYFLFRFLFRIFLPFAIRYFVYKANKSKFEKYNDKKGEKKMGNMTISNYDKVKKDENKEKNNQYIDFEEIE